ncbi:MAG: chorismate lyase [Sulfuricellaceae bacterium]
MKLCLYPTGWHAHLCQTVGAYRPWLLAQGSLTRRIVSRCAAFGVRGVQLQNGWWESAEAGGKGGRQRALLREVCLYCGATPLVYAHSVLPLASLRGAWQALRRLGDRPLGEVLFSDPQVRRAPLHYKKLHPRHWLYRRACRYLVAPPPFLWARRSVFTLNRRTIQVTEVFLPGILDLDARDIALHIP